MTYRKALKPAVFLVAILLAIIGLAGCGGEYSAKVTPQVETGTSSEDTGSDTAAVVMNERCAEVSQAKLDEISAKLNVVGSVELQAGFAVKSNDFDNLYFIAAEIQGPGFYSKEEIALWAADSLEPGGSIYSVNARAKAHSTWPTADTLDPDITTKSDGATEVTDCVAISLGS